MKKIVLILVMLLFTLISYSKGRIVDISSLEIQEGLNYVIGENKPYTGASIKKFENNGIEKKIKYENGLVKVSKTYFENGQLELIKIYKNGQNKKIQKGYYKNGNLKVELRYINQNKIGIIKLYYENGQLWKEIRYVDNKQVTPTKWYCEGGHPLL